MSEFLKDIKKDDLELNQDVVDVLNDNLEEHNNVPVESVKPTVMINEIEVHNVINRIDNVCQVRKQPSVTANGTLADINNPDLDNNKIYDSMQQLNDLIKTFDPSNNKSVFKPGMLLKIFQKNAIQKFTDKYVQNKDIIKGLVDGLEVGSKELYNNNIVIQKDIKELNTFREELLNTLSKANEMAKEIDEWIANAPAEQQVDLKSKVGFHIQQKISDLQQRVAVTNASMASLSMIYKTNIELRRQVERTNNVSVECLALSIQTAKQLAEQMKISKIINETNRITEDLLVSITKSVNEQGVEILKRSTEAVISQEALEKSFSNLYQAYENFKEFKISNYDKMKETNKQLKLSLEKLRNSESNLLEKKDLE